MSLTSELHGLGPSALFFLGFLSHSVCRVARQFDDAQLSFYEPFLDPCATDSLYRSAIKRGWLPPCGPVYPKFSEKLTKHLLFALLERNYPARTKTCEELISDIKG